MDSLKDTLDAVLAKALGSQVSTRYMMFSGTPSADMVQILTEIGKQCIDAREVSYPALPTRVDFCGSVYLKTNSHYPSAIDVHVSYSDFRRGERADLENHSFVASYHTEDGKLAPRPAGVYGPEFAGKTRVLYRPVAQ